MSVIEWKSLPTHILELEDKGLVTRTFRRLDPDRQSAILMAILDEAAEQGPVSLNIKRVAKRAGVSVGSLYTYFGNRERLLAFAVELSIRFVSDSFEEYRTVLVNMPLREGLRAYLEGGLEWGRTQTGLTQFLVRAAYHKDSELTETVVRPVGTAMRIMVRDMIRAARDRGEVRSDLDVDATGRALGAFLIALGDSQLLPYLNAYFQVTDDDMDFQRVVDAAMQIIFEGVVPKDGGVL